MERRAIRVEPYSTYLERRRKSPPEDGELRARPFEELAEIVLQQMKRCLESRRLVA